MKDEKKYTSEEISDFDDQTILNILQYPNKVTPEILKVCKTIAKRRNLIKEEKLNEYDLKAAIYSNDQLINVITNYEKTDIRLVKAAFNETKRRGMKINTSIDFSDPKVIKSLEERTNRDKRLFLGVISVILTLLVLFLKLIKN